MPNKKKVKKNKDLKVKKSPKGGIKTDPVLRNLPKGISRRKTSFEPESF